jgi:hypothetical protein
MTDRNERHPGRVGVAAARKQKWRTGPNETANTYAIEIAL